MAFNYLELPRITSKNLATRGIERWVTSSSEKRNEFLSKQWRPYPCAPKGSLDVALFKAASSPLVSSTFVCGRLGNHKNGVWALSSAGAEISFKFSSNATWLQTNGDDLNESLLLPGDLVCVLLSKRSDTFESNEALLLVPSQKDFQPRSNFTIERSRQWAMFLQAIRDFFKTENFIEATSPTLVSSPGTEPYLDVFSTEWSLGSRQRTFFLPTSPEFHLKKMLVLGWTRIFEIKTCFRNGEIGNHHQPEFHMLEWYRAYRDLDVIADDVEKLLTFLLARLAPEKKNRALKQTTMSELFARHFGGFVLKPETSLEELIELAKKNQISVAKSDSWDDVFFRLFLEKIEATLGVDGPLLVRDYPPRQAALARVGANGFAERFEIYWNGLELANAFHELNDPTENETRFREDHERKKELGKLPVPVDEELVRALYHGLPPSGGIALGLDRLFMAIFDIETIAETRAFPEQT